MKAADLPTQYNVAALLERNLAPRADKIALYSQARDLTFAQVAAEANQVGNALQRLGVRMGDTVGILCLDTAEWVTSYFGIVKIGAVAVCLNTLLKAADYDYMFRDSRLRVLIVDESLLSLVMPILPGQPFLEQIIVVENPNQQSNQELGAALFPLARAYGPWISHEATTLATAPTHRDDICTLHYSSGTTGEPKGIPRAHKDHTLLAQLWAVNVLGLRASDRTFAVSKLFFIYATGCNLLFPWYAGASIVLYSGAASALHDLFATMERCRPTIFFGVPTGYAAMLATNAMRGHKALASLRLCVSAGEALPAPIWQQWQETTGLAIVDALGATEVGNVFLSNRPDDIRPGSSGKPFDGYEVKIVDNDGNEVPPGTTGTLMVKGETTALSYLHQSAKSRQVFRGEWFFTGDQYRVDEDGYYWHAGRADDMLKVGGIWVSPVEVESMLVSHPAVQECAVVGAPDPQDLIRPKAYVVLAPGYHGDGALQAELMRFCQSNLTAYKQPRWIEFVTALPKTATGKIQRFKLRNGQQEAIEPPETQAPATQPVALPGNHHNHSHTGHTAPTVNGAAARHLGEAETPTDWIAPRTPTETALAAIWQDFLKRPVGVDDNFFQIGGDSLQAIQLLARVRETFGVELPLGSLFEHTTVTTLAAQIELLQTTQALLPSGVSGTEEEEGTL